MSSAPASPGPEPESRNDLRAEHYVWFRSTDRRTAKSILEVFEGHGIAAYFDALLDDMKIDPAVADPDTVHVFVDATETAQARSIGDELNAAELNEPDPYDLSEDDLPDDDLSDGDLSDHEESVATATAAPDRAELDSAEVDARFAELIAQFNDPGPATPQVSNEPSTPDVPDSVSNGPTRAGGRDADASRAGDGPASDDPSRPDPPAATPFRPATSDFLAESEDDDHYVPPPPQPLKPLTSRSFTALTVLAIGCVLLFFPGLIGFSGTAIAVTGVVLITAGVGLLLLQLRDGPDDPTDDGARL